MRTFSRLSFLSALVLLPACAGKPTLSSPEFTSGLSESPPEASSTPPPFLNTTEHSETNEPADATDLEATATRAAAEEPVHRAKILTPKGLFTTGIEGPAVDRQGNLFAVNFRRQGTIGLLKPDGSLALWKELPAGGVGVSIRFDRGGRMYVADYKRHRVLTLGKNGLLETYVESAKLHQPNDMSFSRDGVLYLSDPTWTPGKSGGIWRVGKDRALVRLVGDLKAPNGIDLSPDEKILYVADSQRGRIYAYEIQGATLRNRRELLKTEVETIDGLRTDTRGNIYVARIERGRVDKIAPDGTTLARIPLHGKSPSNLAFGGPDGRTVYVTLADQGNIESFRVEHPGREWELQQDGPRKREPMR